MNTNQWHPINEADMTAAAVTEEECTDCTMTNGQHTYACMTNWTDTDIEEEEEEETLTVLCEACEFPTTNHLAKCPIRLGDADEEDEMTLSNGAWTEDSPTLTDEGNIYGQHDGPRNTPHRFRFVYTDGSPVRGSIGAWLSCRDCEEAP